MFVVICGFGAAIFKKSFNSYPKAIQFAKANAGRVYNTETKCKLYDSRTA